MAFHRAYRRLRRTQWLDADGLRELQELKLRRLVDHAYRTVPHYRRGFDEIGLAPGDVRSLDDLERIPTSSKADLQASDVGDVTSSLHPVESLRTERTSGSTGQPLTLRFDRAFVQLRNALFLRALSATGYRVGQRALLVTAERDRHPRRALRWHYVSIEDPPARLLEAISRVRPALLYGPVTPLRQAALHLERAGGSCHAPRAVVCTAEGLDPATRGLLGRLYRAPVFDLYGMTETGIIGFECAEHDGLHVAEDAVILELHPTGHEDELRLVVTNLELYGMPLLRYVTGDLATAGPGGRCRCGRSLRRLARVTGRVVDAVRLSDGSEVSPYRLTLALEQLEGIDRYQIVQQSPQHITLRLECRERPGDDLVDAARSALRRIVGDDTRIDVLNETSLEPPAGRKFRVVQSLLDAGERP